MTLCCAGAVKQHACVHRSCLVCGRQQAAVSQLAPLCRSRSSGPTLAASAQLLPRAHHTLKHASPVVHPPQGGPQGGRPGSLRVSNGVFTLVFGLPSGRLVKMVHHTEGWAMPLTLEPHAYHASIGTETGAVWCFGLGFRQVSRQWHSVSISSSLTWLPPPNVSITHHKTFHSAPCVCAGGGRAQAAGAYIFRPHAAQNATPITHPSVPVKIHVLVSGPLIEVRMWLVITLVAL